MKIKITLPPKPFRTTNRVIYADTDAGGVVYHATYFRFFEIGRTEMIRHWGHPYSTMVESGYILPVTESYIRYKAPAFYDDLLITETALMEVKKVSCRFHYRVTRETPNGKTQLLALGLTAHACVDKGGKLCAFPADFTALMHQIIQAQAEK